MQTGLHVVGLGEALFDVFGASSLLGGAPLNATYHAHQLLKPFGGQGYMVSRVGQDELGTQVHEHLVGMGMTDAYLQDDPDHATGKVYVHLDGQGQPEYDIVEDAAWDWLAWDPELDGLSRRCDALVFSGLCLRHGQTRSTIHRFVTQAKGALRLFDLTLRQNYYDSRTLESACQMSNVVKLNEEELVTLCKLLAIPGQSLDQQAKALLGKFALKYVVLTQGKKGTTLFTSDACFKGEPAVCQPQANADSVGAGDACTAGIVVGLVLGKPLQQVVNAANQLGAYVASVQGATPTLPEALVDLYVQSK